MKVILLTIGIIILSFCGQAQESTFRFKLDDKKQHKGNSKISSFDNKTDSIT